jgi:hypothetical protein
MSREAALRLNVFNEYTYTLETIIQAGQKNMSIISVPVHVNEDLRPSRLLRSVPQYIRKSILTIIRIFVVYKPFRFFITIGLVLFASGFVIGFRFLYYFFREGGEGHVQSLILASILLGIGFQTMLVALDCRPNQQKVDGRHPVPVEKMEIERGRTAETFSRAVGKIHEPIARNG